MTSFEAASGCALLSSHPMNHPGDDPGQVVLGGHQARILVVSSFSHVPAYMPAAHADGALGAFLLDAHAVGNAVDPGAAAAVAAAANRASAKEASLDVVPAGVHSVQTVPVEAAGSLRHEHSGCTWTDWACT